MMGRMDAKDTARAQALWLAVRNGTATEAERREHEAMKARLRKASGSAKVTR